MENLKEKVSQLKNCVNELEDKSNDVIYNKLIDVIETLALQVEELTVNQEAIQENIQFMDDDLSGIQEELFEEVSLEELDDIEEEYIEVVCSSCDKPIFIEKSALEKNGNIPCPYCGNNIM